MRVTDVIVEAYGAPGSRSLGIGNFETFTRHYHGRRLSQNLKLDMGEDVVLEIDNDDVVKLVNYYNDLPGPDNKRDFVYNIMSREGRLIPLLDRLGANYRRVDISEPGAAQNPPEDPKQPSLFEVDKKSTVDTTPERFSTTDPKLAVALRKAYAKQPTARSDIEALLRTDIDAQAATQDDLEQQVSVNQRQQRNIETLRDLARKQSELLRNLDNENDSQSKEIKDLEREINDVARRAVARTDTAKSKDTAGDGKKSARSRAEPAVSKDTERPAGAIPASEPTQTTKGKRKTEPKDRPTAGTPPLPAPTGPRPTPGGNVVPFDRCAGVGPQNPELEEPPLTTVAGQNIYRSRTNGRPNTVDMLSNIDDINDVDYYDIPGSINKPGALQKVAEGISRLQSLAGIK